MDDGVNAHVRQHVCNGTPWTCGVHASQLFNRLDLAREQCQCSSTAMEYVVLIFDSGGNVWRRVSCLRNWLQVYLVRWTSSIAILELGQA